MSNKTVDYPPRVLGGTPGETPSNGGGGGGGGGDGEGGGTPSPHSGEDGKEKSKGAGQQGGGEPADASKTCCFCWCCCCSCSCLTVKNNDENSRTKDKQSLDILNGDETPPSLEEVRSWGESFDRLMKSEAGRKTFREFLKCEYSEENILFWLACEDLKKESNPEIVKQTTRHIYDDYISILSPKEVSLDSRVRESINKNMDDPSPHLFDDAQLQIYTLMHRDSYPRFVSSPLYRKLAQLNSTSRKESTA